MSSIKTESLNVLAIPAFNDNYFWLIHNNIYAAIIDPGDAILVLNELRTHNLILSAILLTHRHIDHVGGVPDLLKYKKVPVYGPANEPIVGVTKSLKENDYVYIPTLQLNLKVIDVPGHTCGHIAYIAFSQGWLFSGDTLFAGGCGRLFDGTPEQMVQSLNKLAMLPHHIQIYCAHEYTLSNLRFAYEIEPNNILLKMRIIAEQNKRKQQQPTIPSTLHIEKQTNPFLRYNERSIITRLKKTGRISNKFLVEPNSIAVFSALREWKNSFK